MRRDGGTYDYNPAVIHVDFRNFREKLQVKVRRTARFGQVYATAIGARGLDRTFTTLQTYKHISPD